jgi:hypothetical protein
MINWKLYTHSRQDKTRAIFTRQLRKIMVNNSTALVVPEPKSNFLPYNKTNFGLSLVS